MQKFLVIAGLIMFSVSGNAQSIEWERLLPSATRGDYIRLLDAFQRMDFSSCDEFLFRLFQKNSSHTVILFTYLVFAQNEGFGIESIENGLSKNLSSYIKKNVIADMPLGEFLLNYVTNPRDRLMFLIDLESQLKYVNWFIRLEIIKEHVNRNKDYVAAQDKLSDLLQRYPHYPILHYYRLLFALKQKNWESFDAFAQAALKKFSRHPEILRLCGVAALERRRPQEAISYYEKAFQASSWHADGVLELVQIYLEGGEKQKAFTLIQKAKKIFPWKREFGVLEQRLIFGL